MKAYITPEKIFEITFGDEIPQIPTTVYIFFYKSLIKEVENLFELEKIKFTRGDFYIEKNKRFGIITNFGVGESGALMIAEELAALGVNKVVAIGAVGCMSSNIKMCDIVIIKNAISQSNIGNIYNHSESEVYTSKMQNKEIEETLTHAKINIISVKTLSVPTIYKETYEIIESAKERNVSVIEMEAFSLALVFYLKGVHFSSIGCVSDILSEEGWTFSGDFKLILSALKTVFLEIQKSDL